MDVRKLDAATRRAFGEAVQQHATAEQWQTLRQHAVEHGHFAPPQQAGNVSVFIVDGSEMINLAAMTCAQPDAVHDQEGTKLVFIRDFAPQVIGAENQATRSRMCVVVDYANVSEGIDPDDSIVGAYLLSAYPCK